MVPSLTAVGADGVPCALGLLWPATSAGIRRATAIAEAGELMEFLRWHAREQPDARGYWMAQAVANFADR